MLAFYPDNTSTFFVTGSDAERVVEYRKRAANMRAHSAAADDDDIRSFFLQISAAYTCMATQLENRALADALKAYPATGRRSAARKPPDPDRSH